MSQNKEELEKIINDCNDKIASAKKEIEKLEKTKDDVSFLGTRDLDLKSINNLITIEQTIIDASEEEIRGAKELLLD